MSIQAVFFDMGGTIETFWHTTAMRLEATPGVQQILLDAEIDLGFSNEALYKLVSTGLMRYNEMRCESLEELPASRVWSEYILPGYPVDPVKLSAIAEDLMLYLETHYYQRAMRPEMPAVLEAIQGMGLKIGLISNVVSKGQVPDNLAQYQIRHYFDPIVLSCEYGRRKPDPAIFHHAARLANVPTSACVYVGDRISRDVIGARKAGFRLAVQIRHAGEHSEADEGALPDAVISQMTELLEILKTEITRPQAAPQVVRAYVFDAGDILYHRPNRGAKWNAFLGQLSRGTAENHNQERGLLTEQAYQGLITQDQYREALLRLYGIDQPELIERGIQILDEEDNAVEFFEGVKETLLALKAEGYLLGIITDTANPIYTKLRWFEWGGFGQVWDSLISSQDIGVRKPAPEIYAAALQQLGISAAQAIFVGHKASELEGARAMGMKTIAFNPDEDAQADIFIENFADMLHDLFPVR